MKNLVYDGLDDQEGVTKPTSEGSASRRIESDIGGPPPFLPPPPPTSSHESKMRKFFWKKLSPHMVNSYKHCYYTDNLVFIR